MPEILERKDAAIVQPADKLPILILDHLALDDSVQTSPLNGVSLLHQSATSGIG